MSDGFLPDWSSHSWQDRGATSSITSVVDDSGRADTIRTHTSQESYSSVSPSQNYLETNFHRWTSGHHHWPTTARLLVACRMTSNDFLDFSLFHASLPPHTQGTISPISHLASTSHDFIAPWAEPWNCRSIVSNGWWSWSSLTLWVSSPWFSWSPRHWCDSLVRACSQRASVFQGSCFTSHLS